MNFDLMPFVRSGQICIANENFKFLDISNFLAPGTSYSAFLKAFDTSTTKGFFPYKFMTSLDKLSYPKLPEFHEFYSDVRGGNTLENQENYAYLQRVWKDQNMQTFADFVRWYNNTDTEPFVEAVVKLQALYRDKHIDIFKTSVSVPGVARFLLFKCAEENQARLCFD